MSEYGESSYRRFLRGDRAALEELVRTYSDELVRFAYGYVRSAAAAEDVAADVFATVFLKAKSLRQEQQLRAYLFKMTRNRAVDYLRRHRREVPLEDVENVLCTPGPEEEQFRRERDEILYRCMQLLPDGYREVLELIWLRGFSPESVARILGKTAKQVYNLHTRAKIALKSILEKEGITREDF